MKSPFRHFSPVGGALAGAALVVAALASGCTPAQNAPAGGADKTGENASPDAGWRLAPQGDLNGFFDCLAGASATLVSAHRGGPAAGFPENAIETFAHTMASAPALLEIDVATAADGGLYLMHDDTLDRTTTGSGPIDSLPFADVARLRLRDDDGRTTDFHPPAFADALRWAKGRAILQIDFKQSTRYEDVIAEINRQQAEDRVILIAYTLAQARRLHRLLPDAMISLNIASPSALNAAVAAGVPADRLLGFTGLETPDPRLNSALAGEDVEVIFGTLGRASSIDAEIERTGDEGRYADLAKAGVDIIATDRPLAAQAALDAAGRGAAAGRCDVSRD